MFEDDVAALVEQLVASAARWPDAHEPLSETQLDEAALLYGRLQSLSSTLDAAFATSILNRLAPPYALLHSIRARFEHHDEQRMARALLAQQSPEPTDVTDMKVAAPRDYVDMTLPATTIHSPGFRDAMSGLQHCMVVGCGALPTSAILLLRQSDMRVSVLDRDAESCELARQLLATDGLRPVERIVNADMLDVDELDDVDALLVTALAGVNFTPDEQRPRLVEHLLGFARGGTTVMFRSANGLGALFYPVVELTSRDGVSVRVLSPPVAERSALVIARPR